MPYLKKKKGFPHKKDVGIFSKRFGCLRYFLYLCAIKTNRGREANSVEALD